MSMEQIENIISYKIIFAITWLGIESFLSSSDTTNVDMKRSGGVSSATAGRILQWTYGEVLRLASILTTLIPNFSDPPAKVLLVTSDSFVGVPMNVAFTRIFRNWNYTTYAVSKDVVFRARLCDNSQITSRCCTCARRVERI